MARLRFALPLVLLALSACGGDGEPEESPAPAVAPGTTGDVVSIAIDPGDLDGAPIGSSDGHLLVIAGFQQDGDVVVNDPAADTSKGVRRVYKRGQFEKIWLEASGGLTYVIHDADHPLLAAKHGNW